MCFLGVGSCRPVFFFTDEFYNLVREYIPFFLVRIVFSITSDSRTMSSTPSTRFALSPKNPNIASPFKSSNSSKLSPVKKFPKPVNNSSKLNFEIWQDPVNTKQDNSDRHSPVAHNDQENVLQPKKIVSNSAQRVPLAPLNIQKFPGYITYTGSSPSQLTTLYQPINFDNTAKSLHKFSTLPNFVTPPRSRKAKFLVKSDPDQVDDCEMHLIKKSMKINKNQPRPYRHNRSLSVGKNDAKFNLIKKNSFTILNTSVSA